MRFSFVRKKGKMIKINLATHHFVVVVMAVATNLVSVDTTVQEKISPTLRMISDIKRVLKNAGKL